jgi:hypothetical protein
LWDRSYLKVVVVWKEWELEALHWAAYWAASAQWLISKKLLLTHGHDLEAAVRMSPAHYAAAAAGLFEVLQAMTMMNLKIFLKKQNGAHPLHYAARYSESVEARYIIQQNHPRREL